MEVQFKLWWCCLNPREKTALTLLLPYFFGTESYIRRDTFNLYWAALGYLPDNPMVVWFIAIYNLIPGEIPDGENPPIPVLYFGLNFWGQFYAFSLTDDFTCPKPCRSLHYSDI